MTGDFERQLAVALREHTPDPPATVTAELVWRRTRRKHRQWLAAAASIVCVLGLALGLTFALGGSANRPAANRLAGIENVVWKDTRSYGTVVFHDGTMRLFDGCSGGVFASRVVAGRLIEGRQLSSDGMCTGVPMLPAVRRAERRLQHFYEVVHGPATWKRNGNELTLTRPGRGSITLRTDGRPAPEVAGTTWKLESYRVHGGDVEYAGRDTLRITPEGAFTDTGAGCPGIAGSARYHAVSIRFRERLSGVGCPMVPAAESALLRGFSGTDSYIIRGNELMLDAGRRGFLVYRAVTP